MSIKPTYQSSVYQMFLLLYKRGYIAQDLLELVKESVKVVKWRH